MPLRDHFHVPASKYAAWDAVHGGWPMMIAASLANKLPPKATAQPDSAWQLETWLRPLRIGQPLPTLPLWRADNLSVPLELEASYEETCKVLRIA